MRAPRSDDPAGTSPAVRRKAETPEGGNEVGAYRSGIQLPWKPSGILTGRWTVVEAVKHPARLDLDPADAAAVPWQQADPGLVGRPQSGTGAQRN
jgi:hypothetical protein